MSSKVTLNKFNHKEGLDRGASKFKETLWYLVKMLFFLTAFPFLSCLKCWILRIFGAKIGKNVLIKPRVNIHFPWKLEVGNDVWIGEDVFILNFEKIKIGSNVCISQRAFLCGGNHNYKNPSMSYRNGSITLENGCWVGAQCFVAPNITIGTDCVVSACSVVTNSLPENMICAGNPCRPIKERF
ncbi:MAG: WcaF family extracellular polysaccharide biosynthesis acetyltransferase [Prevotella sp.]|jgi:putative colanic acid biosynthesis acetyltransferase WcaF|nr:WcaF family extracellular polysaccharide biosynthesis acetyltransferase [Prevotella sp.]